MPSDFPSESDSGVTIAQPPSFVKMEDFYTLKSALESSISKLETRLSLVEEREKMREKTWQERLIFVGIIVALIAAFLVRR